MTLFETLLLAHIIGDWLLQTEWQAVNKDQNWRAMISHVAIYHVIMWITLVLRYGFSDSHVYGVLVVLVLSHAFLDRGWPVQKFMKTMRISVEREPDRWLTITIDQSLHVVLLAAASLYLQWAHTV